MARTNKYTPINFNHIYDKPTTNSTSTTASKHPQPPPPSLSYSSTASRSHGRMLVLTRPSPKPLATQIQKPTSQINPDRSTQIGPDRTDPDRSDPVPDPISLRPLGSTGAPSTVAVTISAAPSKFVPPHLRPGFAGKEERLGSGIGPAGRGIGLPGRVGDDGGRPKSGGGYERAMMRRGGESEPGRPGSGGNRPYSSGW